MKLTDFDPDRPRVVPDPVRFDGLRLVVVGAVGLAIGWTLAEVVRLFL